MHTGIHTQRHIYIHTHVYVHILYESYLPSLCSPLVQHHTSVPELHPSLGCLTWNFLVCTTYS